jgi:hypothetical protein
LNRALQILLRRIARRQDCVHVDPHRILNAARVSAS